MSVDAARVGACATASQRVCIASSDARFPAVMGLVPAFRPALLALDVVPELLGQRNRVGGVQPDCLPGIFE